METRKDQIENIKKDPAVVKVYLGQNNLHLEDLQMALELTQDTVSKGTYTAEKFIGQTDLGRGGNQDMYRSVAKESEQVERSPRLDFQKQGINLLTLAVWNNKPEHVKFLLNFEQYTFIKYPGDNKFRETGKSRIKLNKGLLDLLVKTCDDPATLQVIYTRYLQAHYFSYENKDELAALLQNMIDKKIIFSSSEKYAKELFHEITRNVSKTGNNEIFEKLLAIPAYKQFLDTNDKSRKILPIKFEIIHNPDLMPEGEVSSEACNNEFKKATNFLKEGIDRIVSQITKQVDKGLYYSMFSSTLVDAIKKIRNDLKNDNAKLDGKSSLEQFVSLMNSLVAARNEMRIKNKSDLSLANMDILLNNVMKFPLADKLFSINDANKKVREVSTKDHNQFQLYKHFIKRAANEAAITIQPGKK